MGEEEEREGERCIGVRQVSREEDRGDEKRHSPTMPLFDHGNQITAKGNFFHDTGGERYPAKHRPNHLWRQVEKSSGASRECRERRAIRVVMNARHIAEVMPIAPARIAVFSNVWHIGFIR